MGQPKGPVVLAFHKFGVCEQVHVCACVSARLCVHVCTHVCACAGCHVGEVRERAALPH